MYENLHRLIDCLRLKGMAACLDQVLSEATRNGTALQDTLATLLEAECQDKAQRALDNRLRSARMPWDWSIDTFPFKQQPDIAKSQIMSLAKLDFVKKFENITLIGNPGVGKTGIAIGLLSQKPHHLLYLSGIVEPNLLEQWSNFECDDFAKPIILVHFARLSAKIAVPDLEAITEIDIGANLIIHLPYCAANKLGCRA